MPPRKKGNEAAPPTQIIIKKKLYHSDSGHHGGTWKIAYADFMTAMMTFFLVMWLINTASKEKITRIASYFNPVKLTDRSPTKGVQDNESGGKAEEKTEAAKAGEGGEAQQEVRGREKIRRREKARDRKAPV